MDAETIRIGQSVRHGGRRCYVVGIGPMSVPGRKVELHDAQSGAISSVPLDELEPDGAKAAPAGPAFPVVKITNLGRPVDVDLAPGPERYVFSFHGRRVADLRPLPPTGARLVEWRLTLPDASEAVLASDPGTPPIGAALFFVDGFLNRETPVLEPMV